MKCLFTALISIAAITVSSTIINDTGVVSEEFKKHLSGSAQAVLKEEIQWIDSKRRQRPYLFQTAKAWHEIPECFKALRPGQPKEEVCQQWTENSRDDIMFSNHHNEFSMGMDATFYYGSLMPRISATEFNNLKDSIGPLLPRCWSTFRRFLAQLYHSPCHSKGIRKASTRLCQSFLDDCTELVGIGVLTMKKFGNTCRNESLFDLGNKDCSLGDLDDNLPLEWGQYADCPSFLVKSSNVDAKVIDTCALRCSNPWEPPSWIDSLRKLTLLISAMVFLLAVCLFLMTIGSKAMRDQNAYLIFGLVGYVALSLGWIIAMASYGRNVCGGDGTPLRQIDILSWCAAEFILIYTGVIASISTIAAHSYTQIVPCIQRKNSRENASSVLNCLTPISIFACLILILTFPIIGTDIRTGVCFVNPNQPLNYLYIFLPSAIQLAFGWVAFVYVIRHNRLLVSGGDKASFEWNQHQQVNEIRYLLTFLQGAAKDSEELLSRPISDAKPNGRSSSTDNSFQLIFHSETFWLLLASTGAILIASALGFVLHDGTSIRCLVNSKSNSTPGGECQLGGRVSLPVLFMQINVLQFLPFVVICWVLRPAALSKIKSWTSKFREKVQVVKVDNVDNENGTEQRGVTGDQQQTTDASGEDEIVESGDCTPSGQAAPVAPRKNRRRKLSIRGVKERRLEGVVVNGRKADSSVGVESGQRGASALLSSADSYDSLRSSALSHYLTFANQNNAEPCASAAANKNEDKQMGERSDESCRLPTNLDETVQVHQPPSFLHSDGAAANREDDHLIAMTNDQKAFWFLNGFKIGQEELFRKIIENPQVILNLARRNRKLQSRNHQQVPLKGFQDSDSSSVIHQSSSPSDSSGPNKFDHENVLLKRALGSNPGISLSAPEGAAVNDNEEKPSLKHTVIQGRKVYSDTENKDLKEKLMKEKDQQMAEILRRYLELRQMINNAQQLNNIQPKPEHILGGGTPPMSPPTGPASQHSSVPSAFPLQNNPSSGLTATSTHPLTTNNPLAGSLNHFQLQPSELQSDDSLTTTASTTTTTATFQSDLDCPTTSSAATFAAIKTTKHVNKSNNNSSDSSQKTSLSPEPPAPPISKNKSKIIHSSKHDSSGGGINAHLQQSIFAQQEPIGKPLDVIVSQQEMVRLEQQQHGKKAAPFDGIKRKKQKEGEEPRTRSAVEISPPCPINTVTSASSNNNRDNDPAVGSKVVKGRRTKKRPRKRRQLITKSEGTLSLRQHQQDSTTSETESSSAEEEEQAIDASDVTFDEPDEEEEEEDMHSSDYEDSAGEEINIEQELLQVVS